MLAEGVGRQRNRARVPRYLTMAVGSAEEARLWCRYAVDLGYVERSRGSLAERMQSVIRMLQGLKGASSGPRDLPITDYR